ncbi:RHS repeat domain-containing protein [Agromyces silvae]|uniref:RHS repeat domain-containing protein n=1 Tax=Agromyces silvae TaxID=3388266 RepID=UPI00280A8D40|nr:RHS repeat-associated core domain-containing protein [Agromyces protaetiae]
MSPNSDSPARSRVLLCAAALILTIAFVAEAISPSWAATDAPTAIASALVDDVSLGGEVTGRIDERSGALTVEVPLGGLTLRWDSRMASTDRAELGPGWDWAGLGHVDVRGGVRAFPPAGGVYEAAASSPTGLLDYTIADVHFSQAAGTLPARDDALVGPRPYGFTLSELGGTTTSFDDSGNPLARADPFGNRTDWAWTPGTHLLERSIDPVGVVSRVDRSDPGVLTVTTSVGGAVGATSEIELDGGRVSAVRDAVGARTTFGYARDGRLTRVLAPSGAVTDVSWQRAPDGTVAVDLVRVADASSGEVVTSRQWRAIAGSASGWPIAQDTREASGPVGASLPRYTTHLGDGTTGVESSYSPTHLLVEREVGTGGPSGRTRLSRHTFGYPIDPDIGDVPGRFSRPTEATTTWFSESGAERSVAERHEYDEQGRVTGTTDVAEATTSFAYDDAGRVTEVVQRGADGAELARARSAYDPFGRVTTLTRGNGVVTTFAYTSAGQASREHTTDASGTTLADRSYVYDPRGNLVVAADGTRYTYNAANRVVHEASPEGRAIATAYWADGRRAELSTPEQSVPELSVREPERGASAVTRFYWDGATLLNDVHTRGGDGAAADEQAVSYLMGAGRLARTVTGGVGAGPGTSYTIHDRHGNITALTDAGGAVVERYEYDDYGVTSVVRPETPTPAPFAWQVGDATANPFAYAGEYTDPTGTQYLQARTYDPAIKAFTTADTEPLHNRYAFADLNPIMRVDPTGRSSDLDWGDIMQDSRVKIVNTVLAVLLTIMGFVGMNGLFNGATLSYIVGFWGGLASSLVQAAGTAMLTIDTINSLVDRPFFDPETAGKVQFSGNVVSTIGAIGSSIFKLVRKRGTNQNRAKEKKLQEENAQLIEEKANLTKSNAKLSADHETMTQERDKLTAALRAIDPNHPLLPKPPGAPGPGAPDAMVPPQPVVPPTYAATSRIVRTPNDPLPTMSRHELDGIPVGAWEAGIPGS